MSDHLDRAADPFADTRLPFGHHLEALRWHLWRALLGLVVAGGLSLLCFGRPVLEFLAAPVTSALSKFYHRRVELAKQRLVDGDPTLVQADDPRELEITARRGDVPGQDRQDDPWFALRIRLNPVQVVILLDNALRLVNRPPALATLTITEGLVVYLQVGLYCGALLASPWIFYQLWSFVAAGLYPHEKRLVHVYLSVSLMLFLGGVVLCEFLVMPVAVEYLLSFNEWLGLEPDLRLSNWLSFAILMPLVFGVAFQTPLAMFILCQLGIVDANTFARWRRYALFGLACLAAILSPAPDLISFWSLAAPLCLLYEGGILLCRFVPPAPAPGFGAAAGEEPPVGV